MWLVVTVVTVVAVVASYLTWLAGRLDRLHSRVEATRAALDAQLVRRAAAAGELASYLRSRDLWPDASALAGAAAAARVAEAADREAVENDLSRALRGMPATGVPMRAPGLPAGDDPLPVLLTELEAASTRVVLARRFYNDAVRDTRALRSRRVARWLRLAGHAPLPAYFEIDDTPLALSTQP